MVKTGPKTEAGLMAVSENAKQLDHSAWTDNAEAVEAIELARRLRSTKHGLYASVPIICKTDACPYSHSCPLHELGKAPYGEKCPLEIAAIEDLFDRYCEDMDINRDDPKQQVDLIMVKDLVDADIGLLRCDNKMAWDADYVIHNTVGVTDDGEAITKQELHPLTDYREKLINRKHKVYQLLNSTRKDKEGTKLNLTIDPSERAANMMQVHQDMEEHSSLEEEAERKYYDRLNNNNQDDEDDGIIDVVPIDFEEEE